MSWAETVAIAIASSSVLGAVATVALNARAERRRAAFELKRSACLAALDVVDAVWPHFGWSHGSIQPQPQPRTTIAEVRRCHNLLLVTCRDPQVATLYMECLGTHQGLSMDRLDDLRNAIRRECRLGPTFQPDRERSWLAQVSGTLDAPEGTATTNRDDSVAGTSDDASASKQVSAERTREP